MSISRWITIGLLMGLTFTSACNRYHVIPEDLKGQVDRTVQFDQVKSSPASHRGELVVFGGEVLSAKRLEDKTRIEILQLPLTDELSPVSERTQSKGRFVAFDTGHEIVDPAILKEGTPVTIIGEVRPPTEGRVGESQYEFPTLAIRDMTVWDTKNAAARSSFYYGPYYGYGYRPYHFMSASRVRS